jgi:REP element-mobilizing transposase RayT
MPNHLHFLISPAKDGVSILDFTHQYKGKTTNLSWKLGWKGILWQPRFYDHIVRAEEDLQAIAEYILENPVRKGLVASAEDWQWSGNFSPLPIGP